MAKVELIMPKMGESIMEATILKWVKNVGDTVEMDETILEIATDKVDSEIPSPVEGKIIEVLFPEESVVEVGKAIAIIATEGEETAASPAVAEKAEAPKAAKEVKEEVPFVPETTPLATPAADVSTGAGTRFYSPLVKNIARQQNTGITALETIPGSGAKGRVTKRDILNYISSGRSAAVGTSEAKVVTKPQSNGVGSVSTPAMSSATTVSSGNHEIVEMDRMRRLIADHMVKSKHTSPHVTSFVEADVTNIVNWRNSVKADFQKKHGEKINRHICQNRPQQTQQKVTPFKLEVSQIQTPLLSIHITPLTSPIRFFNASIS